MALVFSVVLCIAFILLKKRNEAIAILLGYVTCFFAVSFSGVGGGAGETLSNVAYWVVHSNEVWFMSDSVKMPSSLWAEGLAIFAGLSMALASMRMWIFREQDNMPPIIWALIAIQILFLVKLWQLPSLNGFYFIWPSILIFCWGANWVDSAMTSGVVLRWIYNAKLLLVICAVSWLWMEVVKWPNVLNTVNQIIEPDQDTKIVDFKRYGFDELSKLNVDCVFQWSNEGIFSYYLNKPFCTRFGYAVYISKDAEIAVLEELRVKPPSLIIYDTPHPWSMSIYGRHMRDRLPNIDQWIKENYEFQTNAAGYVFAIPRRKIKEI